MVILTDCMFRSSIAAIYSLKKLKEEIVAVTIDTHPNPPAFYSRYISKCVVLSSDKEKYTIELLELCKSLESPVILPIGVFTLNIIAENIDKFEEVASFAVANKSTLDIMNDKNKTKELAKNSGVKVPEKTDRFPMVVKPFCGEKFGLKASERYKIVKSEKELEEAVRIFSKYDNSPITEEYISGYGVGVSVVIGNDGIERSAFCHRRLSEYPASGGPSSSLVTFIDSEIIQKTVYMLKKANFVGIAMAEYKVMNGEFYFLEINPRIWGSFGATYKADSDFVEAYLDASRGKEHKFLPKYRIKRIKFVPNIFASVISYAQKKEFKKAFVSLIDALNPFVSNAIFSISDPLPSIVDIFRKRR